uniref:Uncharacterized protein n=1 Tax=Anguilla anguilla TaxID=7936 RepID=A0A0E9TXM7_ANGAN
MNTNTSRVAIKVT